MKKIIAIISLFTVQAFASGQAIHPKNSKMNFTKHSVVSKDGTKIGYKQMGNGDGIIILHGTFESSQSHLELAEALADFFTVYMPDRRGRGMSTFPTQEFSVEKDIEDLQALMQKTNTHNIFGVSAGAIIALKASLVLPNIKKIALWEPPLAMDSTKGAAILNRYDKEIANGDISGALVTAMKGGKFAPPLFSMLPRFILKGFTNKMMKGEESKATKEDVTMRMLAPTVHHDFKISLECFGKLEPFKNIETQTLLVGGSKSPRYLKQSVEALEIIIPNNRKIIYKGLGHGGTGSSEWGGKPKLVAIDLMKFFNQ